MTHHPSGSTSGDTNRVLTQSQKTRKVIQDIFAADSPEEVLRSMPTQTLYMAISRQGLFSCSELIEVAPISKVRMLLDFDCWTADTFNEEAFWNWLELPDAEGAGLELLKKLLQSMDLKLAALIIGRHCDIWISEESTDQAPNVNFFTPDKGRTWIHIKIEDEHRRFLMGRFLAFIFESDTELFYQLISIPQVATDSELEEGAFQDKAKRLESEGFPSEDYAAELNSPADEKLLRQKLENSSARREPFSSSEIQVVRPFTHDSVLPHTLRELIEQLDSTEEFEGELTLLMNAALIRYQIDLSDQDRAAELLASVRGAINIGLERARSFRAEMSPLEVFETLSLRELYRLGLGELFKVRTRARKFSDAQIEKMDALEGVLTKAALLAILSSLQSQFPLVPQFLSRNGTIIEEEGKLSSQTRAIETLEEIEMLESIMDKMATVTQRS